MKKPSKAQMTKELAQLEQEVGASLGRLGLLRNRTRYHTKSQLLHFDSTGTVSVIVILSREKISQGMLIAPIGGIGRASIVPREYGVAYIEH